MMGVYVWLCATEPPTPPLHFCCSYSLRFCIVRTLCSFVMCTTMLFVHLIVFSQTTLHLLKVVDRVFIVFHVLCCVCTWPVEINNCYIDTFCLLSLEGACGCVGVTALGVCDLISTHQTCLYTQCVCVPACASECVGCDLIYTRAFAFSLVFCLCVPVSMWDVTIYTCTFLFCLCVPVSVQDVTSCTCLVG